MVNSDTLITAMVLSAVSEYQRRKELREVALGTGHKRMATTCAKYMEEEIEWLKHSGYPEVIGLNGEFIARKIESVEVPEDFIDAMITMSLFDEEEIDADLDDDFDLDFDEEYEDEFDEDEEDDFFDLEDAYEFVG